MEQTQISALNANLTFIQQSLIITEDIFGALIEANIFTDSMIEQIKVR